MCMPRIEANQKRITKGRIAYMQTAGSRISQETKCQASFAHVACQLAPGCVLSPLPTPCVYRPVDLVGLAMSTHDTWGLSKPSVRMPTLVSTCISCTARTHGTGTLRVRQALAKYVIDASLHCMDAAWQLAVVFVARLTLISPNLCCRKSSARLSLESFECMHSAGMPCCLQGQGK